LRDSADEVAAKVRSCAERLRAPHRLRAWASSGGREPVADRGLCAGRDPSDLADEIAGGGAAMLKRVTADAVTRSLIRSVAAARASTGRCPLLLERRGRRANALAEETLDEVRAAWDELRPAAVVGRVASCRLFCMMNM